jgi:hypothetical protein
MKSTVAALVAFVTIAGAACAQTFPITSYYPTKIGSKYSYNDSASGENFVLQFTEAVNVNGHAAVKLQKMAHPDYDVMSNDGAGILLHARLFHGALASMNPAVVLGPANVTLNTVATTNPNYKNPATGNNTIWTTRFDALEDVAVPAGKYPKCARLELVIKDEKLGTVLAKMNMWLAPGVGMVKRQGQFFGVFYVQQLTAVTL